MFGVQIITNPPSCAPLAPHLLQTLQRYYGRSDFCLQRTYRRHYCRQISLLHLHDLNDHSISNHHTSPCCSSTRYSTAQQATAFAAIMDFAFPVQARRFVRPNRVRYPTDWSLAFSCSPQHLTMMQLLTATGPRACGLEGTFTPLFVYACRRTPARLGKTAPDIGDAFGIRQTGSVNNR